MEKELAFLYGAIDDPKRPLVVIVGGAKVKMCLILGINKNTSYGIINTKM